MLLRLLSDLFRRPRDAGALNAEGLAHYGRGDFERAEACFRQVVRLTPDDTNAWIRLAVVLRWQQRFRSAVPLLLGVIDRQPDLAEAHSDLAVCYNRLRRNADAIAHFRRAIELKPDLHTAHASLVDAYLDTCDWNAVERWRADFLEYRSRHPRELWALRVEPFTALMLFPGAIAKGVAEERAAALVREAARVAPLAPRAAADSARTRIRVGYVSADFHDHATAHLTRGLFEAHDRDRFEIYAYSMGPDDDSAYRRHIQRTCDRFVDIRNETPEATARRIRADGIDILVDMKGYTANSRPQIFALRPAPVQVNWLGYPGTTGAGFIDYVVSDAITTPPGYETEFTEHVVRLPDTYQVNDSRQPIAPASLSRAGAGLPDGAFVYCSFNRLGKIDREIFGTWMEILHAVPGSVLWLLKEDEEAERKLLRVARDRGVSEARIVFTERVAKPEHLARQRLADLFLDTTACNAHTGTSDALWAGLPVLTCPGKTFITRVAASLLHACGLPDLVATDLRTYRDAAVGYARDPDALRALRERLERNRAACALFDTRRFVRHLEAAYTRMQALRVAGAAPESFSVPGDSPSA